MVNPVAGELITAEGALVRTRFAHRFGFREAGQSNQATTIGAKDTLSRDEY
jgi:hypothetical protein